MHQSTRYAPIALAMATAVCAVTLPTSAALALTPQAAVLVKDARPAYATLIQEAKWRKRHRRGWRRHKGGFRAHHGRRHRGWRHRHHRRHRHRRHHIGPAIGLGIIDLLIGGSIAASRADYGDRWERCDARYRSFRWSDGTFQPYGGGPRRLCPYLRR